MNLILFCPVESLLKDLQPWKAHRSVHTASKTSHSVSLVNTIINTNGESIFHRKLLLFLIFSGYPLYPYIVPIMCNSFYLVPCLNVTFITSPRNNLSKLLVKIVFAAGEAGLSCCKNLLRQFRV